MGLKEEGVAPQQRTDRAPLSVVLFWQEESWLSWLFEKVVVVMVCFFVCSIVNSMAQSYAKRKQQEKYSEGKTE